MRISSFEKFRMHEADDKIAKLKKFDVKGEKMVAAFGKYQDNDRTAIELWSAEDGEPWYVATVNVPEVEIGKDEVIIKDYSENEGVLKALQKAGIIGKVVSTVGNETYVVKLLVDPENLGEEYINMFDVYEGMIERFERLPNELKNQIKAVYEKDENAVICGSTALFLYGGITRTPQDLDVISSKHEELRNTIKESSGASRPHNPDDEFDEFYKADQELYDQVMDIAYKAVDFYDLINKVKKDMEISGKMDDKLYGMCTSAWAKLEKNESFKHRFSGIGEYKMCVFEATKEQKPTRDFTVNGITIKVEDRSTVLEYKKMYNRGKDLKDLGSKRVNLFESFNGKPFGIKKFDRF